MWVRQCNTCTLHRAQMRRKKESLINISSLLSLGYFKLCCASLLQNSCTLLSLNGSIKNNQQYIKLKTGWVGK